ncbi:MAG: hypothetical protein AB7S80_08140 [Rhizobiaceae bacterium]
MMKTTTALRLIAVAGLLGASLLTPVAARTPSFEPAQIAATPAEEMFEDAAFGVDPMVTGPVSEEFSRKQAELGCAKAVWPNIPADCYPR